MSRKITFAGAMSIHSSEGPERNGIDGTRARWIYVNGNDEGREAGSSCATEYMSLTES